jgi:hypothetical protein
MKTFVLCCGLLAFAGAAFFVGEAGGWRVYASYPTPGPNPKGYSGTGDGGFILMDGVTPYVYAYSWAHSSIYSSFAAPGGAGAWGIALQTGGNLFVTNNRTSWIYETTTRGSLVNSFRCPFAGPADCEFAWPGFIVAIPDQNIVALLNYTTGSLLGTYAGPGSRPIGCGGYAHFYVADSGTRAIYEDGVPIITSLRSPVGFSYTWSMAPPYDIFVYVVDDATNYFYNYVRDGNAVAPASLGRVKALFR